MRTNQTNIDSRKASLTFAFNGIIVSNFLRFGIRTGSSSSLSYVLINRLVCVTAALCPAAKLFKVNLLQLSSAHSVRMHLFQVPSIQTSPLLLVLESQQFGVKQGSLKRNLTFAIMRSDSGRGSLKFAQGLSSPVFIPCYRQCESHFLCINTESSKLHLLC